MYMLKTTNTKKSKKTNKYKDILCSQVIRTDIMKTPMLSKAIYRFSVIPTKITMAFFKDIEKTLKFIWNHRKTLQNQSNLEKEEQNWRYHISQFQTILQSCSNQRDIDWHKN